MGMSIYKCTKCGAIQTIPDKIEEPEPCILCGGETVQEE